MRLIDADALKALAYKGGAFDYQLVVDWSDIEDAPTIDAVPVVHGRWWDTANQLYKCPGCGYEQIYNLSSCPHCGAKMDVPNGGGV